MLRDRLVVGLRDERIQRRLLQDDTLTFDNAWRITQSMETAAKNTEELNQTLGMQATLVQSGEVHKMIESQEDRRRGKCFRYLGEHWPRPCRFLNAQCRRCRKIGHLVRACQNPAAEAKTAHRVKKTGKRRNHKTHAFFRMGCTNSTGTESGWVDANLRRLQIDHQPSRTAR